MLVSALYNVVDRIFIGNSSGPLGLAGITIDFPIMIIQMAFGGLIGLGATSLVSIRLGTFGGDVAISGMGVVNSLMTLIIMPVIGINQGSQPIIGYNYGAENYDRVKKVLKYAAIAATSISILGFMVTHLFPIQLISLFSKDKELIALGSHALIIFLMMLPLVGLQIVGAGYFQAVGKPKHSMILSLSRQVIILIPALIILPMFFQMQGILVSGPLSDFLSSALTAICLFIELKRLDRKNLKRVEANFAN